MKTKVFFFLCVLLAVACGSDDDSSLAVSNQTIAAKWVATEVEVDGTWMNTKDVWKGTLELMFTEDGYCEVPLMQNSTSTGTYQIAGNTAQCYANGEKTIAVMCRFEHLTESTATVHISRPSDGYSETVRMTKDATYPPYIYRNPVNYLTGTWDIVNSEHGGTVTFQPYSVDIKDGDFEFSGAWGRDPVWPNNISLYIDRIDYYAIRDPELIITSVDLASQPQTMRIVGNSNRQKYYRISYTCQKR